MVDLEYLPFTLEVCKTIFAAKRRNRTFILIQMLYKCNRYKCISINVTFTHLHLYNNYTYKVGQMQQVA